MNNSWKEVKAYLKERLDSSPLTPTEIIGLSGLSKDSYYTIFAPGRENSSMRKSTVKGLCNALNLTVEYKDRFPQFSDPEPGERNYVLMKHAQEALQAVMKEVPKERIAVAMGIPLKVLRTILSGDPGMPMQLPLSMFRELAFQLKSNLVIFESGRIEIHSPTSFEGKHIVPIDKGGSDSAIRNINDVGLQELLSEDNIAKYDISDGECKELANISINRNSSTTLDHWVSILYTLRSLNK